jgi:hypothetical protein
MVGWARAVCGSVRAGEVRRGRGDIDGVLQFWMEYADADMYVCTGYVLRSRG